LDQYISAGDVGRWAYCPLNWKLSHAGRKGTGGKAGIKLHEQVADEVDALEYYQSQARWSIQTSFLLALFAISGAALALELLYLDAATPFRLGLIVLSVGWLMGSLYLFLFDLYFRGRGEQLAKRARIVPGDIAYSHSGGKTPMLESKILPLRGRPDYVVQRDGVTIPVEVKSGKTPRRPYASHAMQVAAYCYLVEETEKVRPPFGVLSYPERQFEIPYTKQLEDELLKTLLRIQLALHTGEAHRDHQNPKRCLGCSRREGCPERLV
jgi:CRISPR-associated exonuclease Cas4